MTKDEDPKTEELRLGQLGREADEAGRADQAAREGATEEVAQHDRRADKAAYLRERLEERARAEKEANDEPEDDVDRPSP